MCLLQIAAKTFSSLFSERLELTVKKLKGPHQLAPNIGKYLWENHRHTPALRRKALFYVWISYHCETDVDQYKKLRKICKDPLKIFYSIVNKAPADLIWNVKKKITSHSLRSYYSADFLYLI